MKHRLAKIKKVLIFFSFVIGLSSCYVHVKTSCRFGSTYKPSEYTFNIDSTYLKTCGVEKVNLWIEKGAPMVDKWIEDSVVYCRFYLRPKSVTFPILPIVYAIELDKKNSLYEITIGLHDIKLQYKTLDSISYKFYENSGELLSRGKFDYKNGGLNYDSLLVNPGYNIYMPYVIEMNPRIKQSDSIIYGDIKLFLTDINDRPTTWSDTKIKFEYSKSNRIVGFF